MSDEVLNVLCPTCQTEVVWSSENLFRPFCCKRCQLIDLGEWANEEKVIAGETVITESVFEDDNVFYQD
ncbi:DNA gyrase inhibitor YacG [Mergibacter septicus]|uniref:DNA gyrase inhibitor YacG n=1 Tax=Mergibacter septicus TaxID=221402 RepID=UPI001C76D99E|nr:DNA gyrase inhibitor YacG [Mergibacter septicus]QDJ13358.1 DNA gyrase inhibitor YacG [Mergibacter septicus]